MDFQEILEHFPIGITGDILAETVIRQKENLTGLWEFALSNQKHCWRGAWLMDKINDKAPELIAPFIPDIIDLIPTLKNDGLKRHFLKIACQHGLPGNLSGDLLDCCFNWVQSSSEAVAIRCWAMDALIIFADRYPEIKQELIAILEEQLPEATPGFRSRARKTINALGRKQEV
ncbi:MAG: hypothetical protein Q8862_11480 [Bacteroidota bacterium]|nr:hypothetical protein [Bacteroidota bacterium]